MDEITNWFDGVQKCVERLSSETSIGQLSCPDETDARSVASFGFLAILPLWVTSAHTVGLLALPDLERNKWPVVVARQGDALTLATDSRTLVPRYLTQMLLSGKAARTELIAQAWGSLREKLAALHLALGGSPTPMDAFDKLISDRSWRADIAAWDGDRDIFERAHSLASRQFDVTDEFTNFANWLDQAVSGKVAGAKPESSFGIWSRQTVAWLSLWHDLDICISNTSQDWLVEFIEQYAGLDTGLTQPLSWSNRPGAGSSAATLVSAARRAAARQDVDDPISSQIIASMVAEHMSYSGLAHLEAAKRLRENKQMTRAWGTLNSAAWWFARRAGTVPQETSDFAEVMCAENRWDDIRWVVDRAAGAGT
jgi:hypothetical protein